MQSTISIFYHSFQAELLKIQRTPILYIALIGGVFITGLIFIMHLFNAEGLIEPGRDPWMMYFDMGYAITCMALLVPYIVILMSSMAYLEHNASAWKYVYSLPIAKSNIYFSKLALALLLIVATYIIYFLSVWGTPYIVDLIHPEYGFRAATPELGNWIRRLVRSFLCILAVVGLQYWVSIRWQSFIIPIGIGLLGFIVAIICVLTGKYDYALWIPHAYASLMALEIGITEESDIVGLTKIGWFYRVELLSMALFVIFVALGYIEQMKQNVK
ncbi:MAG: ABC transporter permease [Bacteroidota bacterium]